MTKREIASLSCKILSIYAIINALGTLQMFFAYFIGVITASSSKGPMFGPWMLLSALMPFILLSTFAVFLWLLSDGVAIVMVKSETVDDVHTASIFRLRDVLPIAFAIIGVYEIAQQSFPMLALAAADYFLPRSSRVSFHSPQCDHIFLQRADAPYNRSLSAVWFAQLDSRRCRAPRNAKQHVALTSRAHLLYFPT